MPISLPRIPSKPSQTLRIAAALTRPFTSSLGHRQHRLSDDYPEGFDSDQHGEEDASRDPLNHTSPQDIAWTTPPQERKQPTSSSGPWGQPFSTPDDRPMPPSEPIRRRYWQEEVRHALIREIKYGEPLLQLQSRSTRPLLLTLDAFDTLFTPRIPVPQQYCAVAAASGIRLNESEVAANFKKAFKELSSTHPNYGKHQGLGYDEWWTILIENTLRDLIPTSDHHKLPTISSKLVTRFSSKKGYKLFDDVLPFLSMVGASWNPNIWSPRRTMLGIISNSDPRVTDILDSFDIPIKPRMLPPRYNPGRGFVLPAFTRAIPSFATFSYTCGHSKPDPMIFNAAAHEAQQAFDALNPVDQLSRTALDRYTDIRTEFHHLHVGDELEKDVLPALACGWDAVWLDRSASDAVSIRDVNGQQITVINNLLALCEVISKDRLEHEDGSPAQEPVWMEGMEYPRPITAVPAVPLSMAEAVQRRTRRRLETVSASKKSRMPFISGRFAWRRVKSGLTRMARARRLGPPWKRSLIRGAFKRALRNRRIRERERVFDVNWPGMDLSKERK